MSAMYAKESMEFKETGYESPLSAEQQQALTNLVRNGDEEATQKMIDQHLRLIVNIARQHCNRGMALSELIRVGNQGLIYALVTLDEKTTPVS